MLQIVVKYNTNGSNYLSWSQKKWKSTTNTSRQCSRLHGLEIGAGLTRSQ